MTMQTLACLRTACPPIPRLLVAAPRRLSMMVLLLAGLCHACGPEAPDGVLFPCGNGRCQIGVNLCVLSSDGQCGRCYPLEATCDASDGCECIESFSPDYWEGVCADAPQCEPSGEGLLVRCAPDGWACG